MSTATILSAVAIVAPVLAGGIGWFLLWRRNVVIYRFNNIHFCGDDIAKNGFWAPNKGNQRPLFDAIELQLLNFGIKHLDLIEFNIFNVSQDFIAHPEHGNDIPDQKFSFSVNSDNVLTVKISDVPAFERIGLAILNTSPNRKFWIQGSGKNYKIILKKNYFNRIAFTVLGIISISYSIFSIGWMFYK